MWRYLKNNMGKSKKIIVKGSKIGIILHIGDNDFISLTDMAKYKTYWFGDWFGDGPRRCC